MKRFTHLRIIAVLSVLIISFGCAKAQSINQNQDKQQPVKSEDLSRFFENIKGTIVLYDSKTTAISDIMKNAPRLVTRLLRPLKFRIR